MRTKMTKTLGLSLLLVAMVAILVSVPALAQPQGPAVTELGRSAPVMPQPPVAQDVIQHAAPAAQAMLTFDLCASDGVITLPDSTAVPVWGFVDTGGGACTPGLVTSLPGPVLQGITAGDSVTIHLTNALAVPTSILIPGQNVAASGFMGTFTSEADPGTTAMYSFVAQEGTYLYESGTNASIQIPMGLYGALIVDPATSGQAYGHAVDQEAVLLLSEIDPALNANPGGFNLLNYHPTYWLINGVSYPDTATIAANPGERVLLRYLNAGFDHPSMALLGAYQQVIAKEAYVLTNPFDVVAETIPAGTTADMIVDTTGLGEMSLALYNRNMYMTNGDAYPGGMLTFLQVQAPTGTPPTVDIVSPAQGSTVFGDVVAIQIDATDVEDAAGSLTVEWNVDGGAWQPASWTGTYYEATWDTTTFGDGAHTINARATDSDTDTANDSNSVVVSNVPGVSVVAPGEGASTFGDTVLVQIDASDAEDDANLGAGMLTVEWNMDGAASAPATYNGVSGYYEATMDTTGLTDGAHTINAQATDSRGFNTADGNNVAVSNQPTINIVAPADGATVSSFVTVQIDASDAEDAAGTLTVAWDVEGGTSQPTTYNSGTGYYEATWDTATAGSGAHTINASATDSRSNIATDSNSVTVGANSIHIGDLDGSSTAGGGPNWTATVMATVHAVDESPVAGATVSVDATRTRKSNGSPAVTTLTCVTDDAGQCSLSQTVNSNQFENDVSFTVTDVTNAAPYQPADNHDPDGPDDSDGTTIVVQM